jgi:predicted Rossmann fold flavoprotein
MAAITAKELRSNLNIAILEKSPNFLGKVRISGGGRCNVTNAERNPKAFSKKYPRGEKAMQKILEQFGVEQVITWFNKRGVHLKTEPDGRMFPTTNNSLTIVDCLMRTARELGIELLNSTGVEEIVQNPDESFSLTSFQGQTFTTQKIILACGGFPKEQSYHFINQLAPSLEPPVPSLFTLNSKSDFLGELSGISVPNASLKIIGEKLENKGPLLITHWGLSGPAALVLSAFGAKILAKKQYQCQLLVHWESSLNYNQTQLLLDEFAKVNPKKLVWSNALLDLPSRLWKLLAQKAEIKETDTWLDLSNKKKNKLLENLVNFPIEMEGKSTNKDEFVTCGGIHLDSINLQSMALKHNSNVYCCGEVMDIDAVTGGYNFQAAWSSGFIAGKNSCL